MSGASIAGADWLMDADLQRLLAALNTDGEEARIAGGAVRNALIGQWPASAGHLRAWWMYRHRRPPFTCCRSGIRSGGRVVNSFTGLARSRWVATKTHAASLKSP